MQWNRNDVERYVPEKQYVDTLLIPLTPFSVSVNDEQMSSLSNQYPMINIFTQQIENEFMGRIFLAPNYMYSPNMDMKKEVERLNEMTKEALSQSFKYILYVTADNRWKKVEKDLEGSLIWIPALKTSDFSSDEAKNILTDQIQQVTELIQSYWEE